MSLLDAPTGPVAAAPLRYVQIDSIATETRRAARFTNPYDVDVDKIARAVDCDVEYVTFDPGSVAAQTTYRAGHAFPYLIQVNGDSARPWRRFALAHGIAHVVLHSGATDFRFVDYHLPLLDYVHSGDMYREVEANNFAGALLMPEPELRRAWTDLGDVDDVAIAFSVPREAVTPRLSALQLLDV